MSDRKAAPGQSPAGEPDHGRILGRALVRAAELAGLVLTRASRVGPKPTCAMASWRPGKIGIKIRNQSKIT